MFKKLWGGLLVGIGYLLSPLSWWNDLFFNLPIALLFGYLVSWMNADWFLPAIAFGYWVTNVLGLLLMHFGAIDMFLTEEKRNLKRDLLIGLGSSTLYTLLVVTLVYFHVLELPNILKSL